MTLATGRPGQPPAVRPRSDRRFERGARREACRPARTAAAVREATHPDGPVRMDATLVAIPAEIRVWDAPGPRFRCSGPVYAAPRSLHGLDQAGPALPVEVHRPVVKLRRPVEARCSVVTLHRFAGR